MQEDFDHGQATKFLLSLSDQDWRHDVLAKRLRDYTEIEEKVMTLCQTLQRIEESISHIMSSQLPKWLSEKPKYLNGLYTNDELTDILTE